MTAQEKKALLMSKIRELGIADNTQDPRFAEKVKELEGRGFTVFHVIPETRFVLGWSDVVYMTSYCGFFKEDYQSKKAIDFYVKDLQDGYVMTDTVNRTWDIEEYGTIGAWRDGENLRRSS